MKKSYKSIMKYLAMLMISVISIAFYSCNFNNENEIKDFIKKCASDLIKKQLDSSIRKADYYFEEQKFTMYIDSTGKPIFFEEGKPTNEIDLQNGDEIYTVELNDGNITVE
jgi:hypothetical protein